MFLVRREFIIVHNLLLIVELSFFFKTIQHKVIVIWYLRFESCHLGRSGRRTPATEFGYPVVLSDRSIYISTSESSCV